MARPKKTETTEPVVEKKKTGRPKIEIDQESFEGLCALQCTLAEISSFFKCSEDTIERWCKRTYGKTFVFAYKDYAEAGKISMRRNLLRLSERNAACAIFLAKNYLGMSDRQEVELKTVQDDSSKAMDAFFEAKRAQQAEIKEASKRLREARKEVSNE